MKAKITKRSSRYQLRLFLTAAVCIWVVVFLFAWVVYRHEKQMSIESVVERVGLSTGTVINLHKIGTSPAEYQAFLNFVKFYLDDSYLTDISIQVYDEKNHNLIAYVGRLHPDVPLGIDKDKYITLNDSSTVVRMVYPEMENPREKIFFYSECRSPDGEMKVRTYVPRGAEIDKVLAGQRSLFILMFAIGIFGTILVYIYTAHQAKNVRLLHEFATRAATDGDFVPMGDFPPDEIGDISRTIISIYNERMQANMRREREHAVALKAIEEKNQIKRMLTDNISHELKTPIGIVHAYVEMLLGQPDMPEADRMHFLEKTQQNVDRLITMLNNLSTMTRLEESSGNIPLKPIDFHALVYNLVEDTRASGILHEVELDCKLPADCMVIGNEGLLNSVFNNLIKNSLAYSQCTHIGIDLVGRTDRYFTFSYHDNGVGVGDEHLPHLFDRFYRIDVGRSRKTGGAGLGLSIVKSSINTMGGSISARQYKEGGLEFIFTLSRVRK